MWIAEFDGPLCGICDDDIKQGDECVYVDDEACHLRCAEDEEGVEIDYDA